MICKKCKQEHEKIVKELIYKERTIGYKIAEDDYKKQFIPNLIRKQKQDLKEGIQNKRCADVIRLRLLIPLIDRVFEDVEKKPEGK